MVEHLTKAELHKNPIVTELKPLEAFYPAEFYHEDYYLHNSRQPYCQVVISPKLKKLKEEFSHLISQKKKKPSASI